MTKHPPSARPATERLSPTAWLSARDSSRLLGALAWGAPTGSDPFAMPLPVLDGSAATDAWWSSGPVRRGRTGSAVWRQGGGLCFGAIDVPNAGRPDAPMGVLAWQAYTDLFAALRESGHDKLLRVWNVVPHINGETGVPPLERYRQFNIGRQQAFVEQDHDALAGAPAACAVGSHGDTLSLRFLAARTAGEPVENPRQVPAWAYPAAYGPKAPSFTRATLVDAGGGRRGLLVSGTASIVGHQTLHEERVGAQTEETLENLHAVLAQAALQAGPGTRFDPTAMQCTVYLRRPEDAAVVRNALAQAWGAACPAVAQAVFVRADICRRELLVEIEGHLWPGAA